MAEQERGLPHYGQALSHDGHSLPPRPTPPTPQSLCERSYKDHRKSSSWTDTAATIFRGSPRHSNDPGVASFDPAPQQDLSPQKISRSSSESTSHGHGSVGIVNGRRVLRKERLDSSADTSDFGQTKRRSKAMFTIGNDLDDFIPPMAHSANNSSAQVNLPSGAISLNASVVALSAEGLPGAAASTYSVPNTAHRPPLVRRDALMHGAAHIGRRRWTLADAMTDEGISDVGLVRELERMREVAEWARRRERMHEGHVNAGSEQDEDWDGWDEWDVGREILEGRDVLELERQRESQLARDKERENARLALENGEVTAMPLSDSPESEVPPLDANNSIQSAPVTMPARSMSSSSTSWLMAQRALLTCRELILTERHYLSLLSALVRQETSTPPPPLMVHYAAELVAAADAVLKGMEREPSARGVARAFLERENELEGAYTRWCGVVGGWFSGDGSLDVTSARGSFEGDRSTRKRSRGSNRTDTDGSNNDHGDLDEDLSKPLKRSVSTWRKSMPSIPSLGLDNGSIYGGSPCRRDKEDDNRKPIPRKPDVRELAILPTQRVMRYVLLYRDLLSHTPSTSTSRPLVERAVDAACRIADKCDRAQGNAAFVVSAASPSSFGVGSRNNSKHRGLRASTSKTSSPSTSRIVSAASVTGHSAPPVPTTSPALASPPTSAKSTSRPSSPAFGESPNSNNPNFGSRRLSMTAMSFVTLGWNKNQRGLPFGPVDAMPVTAVAPI
ncbi:hypothetical protein CPB83DRAFT_21111 [Crepidotus variabilis]|uniref:DH domain-containing protein n=1 Tax=Crepidotus variabilis TaxID=179855 RepID=A0A9P6EVC9_9AGAR|nr:hypothetical protein CPB83DRAFT_21111 [Crepidotus variabilis]